MKLFKIFLLLLVFWLQYSLWIGNNGVLDFIKKYNNNTKEKKNNQMLEDINNKLKLDIEQLYAKKRNDFF